MKAFERLVLESLWLLVKPSLDSSQFTYRPDVRVDNIGPIYLSHHAEGGGQFYQWNYLQLNISKTKELVVDFRRSTTATPLSIWGEMVGMVQEYK